MSGPQLAPGVRRVGARLLVGGTPARVLQLTPAGSAALDAVLGGTSHPQACALRARLLERGLLLLPPGSPRLDELTLVVPVRGSLAQVRRVLAGVPPGVPVVVVDDGSTPPLELPVPVVRHDRSRGPAAARNAGLAQVRTALVAFVDADVALPAGALERLTGHLADERVVAAAPRVRSDPAPGAAGILEQQLGALDQGAQPAEVRRGAKVSHVPSAVLVVRTAVVRDLGGFDERLQVGEDVDLVWRFGERGAVRYDPAVVVRHAPRARLGIALRRRYDYGTSAAPLDRRHPGRLRHLRLSRFLALPWAAALLHPAAGVAAAAGLIALAPRRLPLLPAAEARRVAVRGLHVSSGAVGRYAVRPGFPLTAAALLLSPHVRRVAPLLVTAYVAGSLDRLRAGPARDLPVRAVLHVIEDLVYSAGVWRGAVAERRWRVLLPGL